MSPSQARNADRMRVLRPAKIVWDNAHRTVDCTVRDMSKTGALLQLSAPTPLPDSFDIILPPAKDLRAVTVMRRMGLSIGVMFVDAAMSAGVESGGGGSAIYNPALGTLPIYAPVSAEMRALLPW